MAIIKNRVPYCLLCEGSGQGNWYGKDRVCLYLYFFLIVFVL